MTTRDIALIAAGIVLGSAVELGVLHHRTTDLEQRVTRIEQPAPTSPHECAPPLCQILPAPTTSEAPAPRATPTRASRSRHLATTSATGPTRPTPDATGPLLNWPALRECENSGSYTSDPGDHYRGAYQFDQQTWTSVGGTGDPAAASPSEQDMRARRLYDQRGRQPWPICGRYL